MNRCILWLIVANLLLGALVFLQHSEIMTLKSEITTVKSEVSELEKACDALSQQVWEWRKENRPVKGYSL